MTAAPSMSGADLATAVRGVADAGHSNLGDASAAADGRHASRRKKESA
jgi:hypothetical protein